MEIKTVTVVGANGNMGANVSGLIASFGEATVYIVSREIEESKKAIEKICQSVRSDDIKDRLIPTDYSNLEFCVGNSDWVFESVAEVYEVKIQVTNQIFQYASSSCLITTGTSGLSINKISEELENLGYNTDNYFGTHFFNPPYNLSLVEIIAHKKTNSMIVKQFSVYLEKKLSRKIVNTADVSGFLANRVGFQFINRLMLLAEEYSELGGIDYIDYIFGGITGRKMPPLVTTDFVGLDIHQAIVTNIYEDAEFIEKEYFKNSQTILKLISDNHLGKKVGRGLYKKIAETGENLVYDIKTNQYRKIIEYKIPIIEKMKKKIQIGQYEKAYALLVSDRSNESKLIREILNEHIKYALSLSKKVSGNYEAVSISLENGFNWIGPEKLVKLLGYENVFSKLERETLSDELKSIIFNIGNKDYQKYLTV